jgi:hypothetical protein
MIAATKHQGGSGRALPPEFEAAHKKLIGHFPKKPNLMTGQL